MGARRSVSSKPCGARKPQPRCRDKALLQSDNDAALLAAVETQLCEFENLCGALEEALMQRSWPAVKSGIADSRRVAARVAQCVGRGGSRAHDGF